MLTKTVVIKNPTGLHLRPAGNLCKEAVKYKSKITFNYRTTIPMPRVCFPYWQPA